VNDSFVFDAKYHHPKSVAFTGRCSQHGTGKCANEAVISFRDRHGRWQSGCERAKNELVARGEIAPPRS
jgi:hypothetical protein